MASNDDRESHSDAQPRLLITSLDAVQACLTSLRSRVPHDHKVAIDEIDEHLAILEEWVQNGGDLASTTQAEITGLKVSRNAALPIHTLPGEILACIFLICLEPMTWRFRDITRLMSVCASWKSLLEDSCMFWPKLHSKYPPHTLELVLSRNASGPLRVICSKNEETAAKLGLLELAAKHSTRWCNVAFEGVICDAVKEKLQVDTPNLTEICVFSSEIPRFRPPVMLALSEGKPFRHVVLDGAAIRWDMSRLRGLRSLQLSRIRYDWPSLSQLRTVLASSPGLWYLKLSEVGPSQYDAGDHSTDTSAMLFLPELSTLVLQKLSRSFMSHLLTHIQSPACHCVVAADVAFSVASDPAFNDLITPALRISDGVRIISSGASIFIYSTPRPHVHHAWLDCMEESVGIKIALRRDVSRAASKADVQSVLNTVMTHASSKLTVVFIPSRTALQFITAPEILRLLPSTKAVECESDIDIEDLLRFLIAEKGEGSGRACPELESLMLAPREDGEVELIRTFLRLHQKNSQELADALVRPLKRMLLPQNILDTLEVEGLLEGLEARCAS